MTGYPLLDIFWTMFEIFLFVMWFFLLFKVISDIFRSDDMGGWGKAGWTVFVVVLPLFGVLVYLIARGRSMGERDVKQAQQADAAFKSYIRDAVSDGTDSGMAEAAAPTASGPGTVEQQLAKLSNLKGEGLLTEAEYQTAKARVIEQQNMAGSGSHRG